MEPTNLLFIMSDQHNADVLGCYGNDIAQTQNLDTLATRGTRMANAYCTVPVCVPSRASVATGRYANTIESWDNASPYVGTETSSWGHRLTSQGRAVTTIGKLHHRAVDDPNGFPDQRIPMHVFGGTGDLRGLLRGAMPVTPSTRQHVDSAGIGESEYIHYDRTIAQAAADWLQHEASPHERPWALFVSFVSPHFPLVVTKDYFDLFSQDDFPLPVQGLPEEWPHHLVLDLHRRLAGFDVPMDEGVIRNAMVAYYGLVSFLDAQIVLVLEALENAGLGATTRIIYTSDHGEMLGERGLWGKSTMYDASVSVPMILCGPGVPTGSVSHTNASLVDCFPSIIEAVGGALAPEDADLPGESLWALARTDNRSRSVFSEYHAAYSPSGIYMIRNRRYKYVHYIGYPPQLFDMIADPHETHDLATDPRYREVLQACEAELRAIVDPVETDHRAKASQNCRIANAGGAEAVIKQGNRIPYTPAPSEFNPVTGQASIHTRNE